MASWSSVVTIQLSHQECEHNDFATHGIAPPLGFAKSLNEVPEDGLEHHQVKPKVDDNVSSHFKLFVKGQPKLILNHIIIYKDMAKKQQLDDIVETSTARLKVKTAELAILFSREVQ